MINVDVAFIPPHFVSLIASDPAHLDIIGKRLDGLISGGGQIHQLHGNLLASRLRFMSFYGATETGSIPELMSTSIVTHVDEAWSYIRPHPAAGWKISFL